jgi:hypothetical protein
VTTPFNTAQATHCSPTPALWRVFLRCLAREIDAQHGPEARILLLRDTGRQMAALLALPPVGSLEALEIEMNGVLAEIDWGGVSLSLNEAERCVLLIHRGLPRIGSAGEPCGTWLAPVLEGLYEGWMAQQPGSEASFQVRIKLHESGSICLRYGR